MSRLLLDSLEIKNFRAFDHLQIPKLGRVNLLTGKNNVGKTSVLEALELYASNGSPATVRGLLSQRGQYAFPGPRPYGLGQLDPTAVATATSNSLNIRYLFHKAPSIFVHLEPISIGTLEDALRSFNLKVEWLEARDLETSDGFPRLPPLPTEAKPGPEPSTPYVTTGMPGGQSRVRLLDLFPASGEEPIAPPAPMNYQVLRSFGLGSASIAKLWDQIQLTEREQTVIQGLRIVAPQVERASIKQSGQLFSSSDAIVKLRDSEEVVPLKMLGDGINRLFGLMLALVNASDGMLLIDELENGLHYSVMGDVWRLIFTVSKQLNVQVFATTHSYDCIEAFQEAAQENKDEGVLLRIENRNGRISTTDFDDRRLEIATKQLIEVR